MTGQLLNGTQFTGSCQTCIASLRGDVNCDGKVGPEDLQLLANAYHSHPGDPNWNDNVDFAAPWDVIGLTDRVITAIYYGQHYPKRSGLKPTDPAKENDSHLPRTIHAFPVRFTPFQYDSRLSEPFTAFPSRGPSMTQGLPLKRSLKHPFPKRTKTERRSRSESAR